MSSLFYITFAENGQPAFEFNIKNEKLTWESLTHSIIQFHSTACIELPIVLYYKHDDDIKVLESQSQLQELLYQNKDKKPMYLFDAKEIIDSPVFKVISTPSIEMSAFSRLGQLIDSHKKIISSSRHLSRCVGILASAIALDTNNKDFDKEFKALEKVIESRKDDCPNNSSAMDQQSKETLKNLFESHRPKKRELVHHHGGRGRGDFHRGRGHFHHPHHHHHHHHGGPADFFYAAAEATPTAEGKHQKTQACFGGRHESSSAEEEMEALQSKMRNLHIKKHHHPRGKRGRNSSQFGFF